MAPKTIDVPGDGAKNVSSQVAWKWLGIGRELFERLAKENSSWLKPTRIASTKGSRGRVLWDALDIWALGRILERSSESQPPDS